MVVRRMEFETERFPEKINNRLKKRGGGFDPYRVNECSEPHTAGVSRPLLTACGGFCMYKMDLNAVHNFMFPIKKGLHFMKKLCIRKF